MGSTFRSVRGNRNAKLFFTGLLASNIGTWVQFTATAILVDRLTGQTTAIGILSAAPVRADAVPRGVGRRRRPPC